MRWEDLTWLSYLHTFLITAVPAEKKYIKYNTCACAKSCCIIIDMHYITLVEYIMYYYIASKMECCYTHFKQNANAEVHEGLGEIYNTFASIVDGLAER
jgi:hypothetical protein